MSLPSGFFFYLDYTYGSNAGGIDEGSSIYGGPAGKAIQNGADAVGGQYDLVGSGFSRKHKAAAAGFTHQVVDAAGDTDGAVAVRVIGAPNADGVFDTTATRLLDTSNAEHLRLIDYDSQVIQDITENSAKYAFVGLALDDSKFAGVDLGRPQEISISAQSASKALALPASMQEGSSLNLRRVTKLGIVDADGKFVSKPSVALDEKSPLAIAAAVPVARRDDVGVALCLIKVSGALAATETATVSFVEADTVTFSGGEATGNLPFEGAPEDRSTPSPVIPEIDIKIESIPVTAQTRKLRARWSPELAQDLNAYHSMDAEVELTQILSEQIALEIDREILGDLLNGAKGANFFWSRSPGKFVNKRTGGEIARTSTLNPGPAFTGTVREWYETLTETVIDVANEIHRKTLRGSANFIVVSPDVATILEASVLYRPSYSLDGDGQVGAPFTMGAEKIGSLSNRFTVYKDPYFPRNKILVGYKGGSYLETGFVYAPYVPLIVTPTIFQPEDFTPRKGVMTRYGKKMVRADFYGTVTCLDMNII
jgi:hypothetical protein